MNTDLPRHVILLGMLTATAMIGCQKTEHTDPQAASSVAAPAAPAATGDTARAKYTCPMHPEVVSDKPGRCAKCGMDLEPVGTPK